MTFGAHSTPTITSLSDIDGSTAGGETTIVTGTHFHSGCRAYLDAVEVTATIWNSETSITILTQAHPAGLVNLLIRNPGGEEVTAFGAYTFTAGGAVAVVVDVDKPVSDPLGGRTIIVEVDSSTGCTAIEIDGVACTGFAIPDGTHVSGVVPAHAVAASLDIVVTNATGDSTTGGGLFRYWNPTQISATFRWWHAARQANDAGAGACDSWIDQSAGALDCVQATGANRPIITASQFGSRPGLVFTPQQWLRYAGLRALATGTSMFALAKWSSADTVKGGAFIANPLTIVGDNTNAYNCMGASAGVLQYGQYVAGEVYTDRGSGLNDGNAHHFGWTHDLATGDLKAYLGTAQQGATATVTYSAVNNCWNTLGNAYGDVDGWAGSIGFIGIEEAGVVSGADITLLDEWCRSEFELP
jgi:hypothetical protein